MRDLTPKSTAPMLTYEEGSLVKRSIRDLYSKDIEEVAVAGPEAYHEAKDFMRMLMPSHAKNVKLYAETQPLLPLDVQGDGTRSAMRGLIVLSLLKGTLFLMEEPECHQHPGSLERFAQAICRQAREQEVQILISTHSAECVRAFLKGADTAGSEGAVFHLTLRASFGRVDDAHRHLSDMDRLYLSTVETLAMAIDAKDDVLQARAVELHQQADEVLAGQPGREEGGPVGQQVVGVEEVPVGHPLPGVDHGRAAKYQRHHVIGQTAGAERIDDAHRSQRPQRASRDRNHEAFRQRLPHQPLRRRPQRRPHRKFLLPRHHSRHHQPPDIHATHE